MLVSTSSVASPPPVTSVSKDTPHTLEKTGNGEITAASVAKHPDLAGGLIKLKDGNYAYPIVSASDRAGSLEAAVLSLKRGG